jgi:hypothetical protein
MLFLFYVILLFANIYFSTNNKLKQRQKLKLILALYGPFLND